jgi:GNAT superfamily N-acetyltransferase
VTAAFPVETLGAHHDRTVFCCGVDALDRHFRERVTQDVRRRATACYVVVDAAAGRVAGYHTLAASGVNLRDLPDNLARRLPRYPLVPVARLGRLAVDEAYRGRQLGAVLLWDAAMRAARSELGVFAVVVDAKDDRAAEFYVHHGFAAFGGSPHQLILSLMNFSGVKSGP